MINVAIVEDNDTIREGLAALINGTTGYKSVGFVQRLRKFFSKTLIAGCKCCSDGYCFTGN